MSQKVQLLTGMPDPVKKVEKSLVKWLQLFSNRE